MEFFKGRILLVSAEMRGKVLKTEKLFDRGNALCPLRPRAFCAHSNFSQCYLLLFGFYEAQSYFSIREMFIRLIGLFAQGGLSDI